MGVSFREENGQWRYIDAKLQRFAVFFLRFYAIAFIVEQRHDNHERMDVRTETMQHLKPASCVRLILVLVLMASAATWAEKPDHDFFVGAYYYPWYSNNFHGGNYVREHLVPPQLPELGEYNDREFDVIAQHLAWSRFAGVDFWVASWWGPQKRTDVTLRDYVFPHTQLGDHKIALFYETTGRTSGFTDYTNIGPDITYIAATYFDHPNYLKIDGKPVLFVYLTRVLTNNGTLQTTVATMRDAATTAGHELYVVGDQVFGSPPGTAGDMAYLDAVTNYDVYGSSGGKGYAGQQAVTNYYAKQSTWKNVANSVGTSFIPAVSPGFNDKGVRDGHDVLSRKLSAEADHGTLFDAMLQGAKPLAQADMGYMLMVNSWNEWHEDTQIEPLAASAPTSADDSGVNAYTSGYAHEGYGNRYLDILREETVFSLPSEIFVDAANTNAEDGSQAYPYNTVAEGVEGLSPGGVLTVAAGNYDETMSISKAMTIQASGGTVRIGASGAKSLFGSSKGALVADEDESELDRDSDANDTAPDIEVFWEMLMARLRMNSASSDAARGEATSLYEPAMPFETDASGNYVAQPESIFAVRIRNEANLDPSTIGVLINGHEEDGVIISWRSADGRSLNDIWVIAEPKDRWLLEELVTVSVAAETENGVPVEPVNRSFSVATEGGASGEELWQPEYDVDFDADGINRNAESSDGVEVRTLAVENNPEPLDAGIGQPILLTPERVYEVPQRIWLPIPKNVDPADVSLFYYLSNGEHKGWHPAGQIDAWLVPGSYLYLEADNMTYLGFLVRHAGIVQLGISIAERP